MLLEYLVICRIHNTSILRSCTARLMARLRGVILLWIIGKVCIVRSTENINNHEMPDNIVEKCIVDILASKTQFGSIVAVVNNEDLSNGLLHRIHSLNNVKVLVKDSYMSVKVTPTVYVLFARNLIKLEKLIDNLDRDWYRQPEALFIVIVKNLSVDGLAAVFKILWEYHFIHVLVIINDLNEDASIYTYLPYAESRCGRDYNYTIKLSNCQNAREFDVLDKLREYDKPVLDNCTLNVGTRNYPPLVMCDPEPEDKLAHGIERFLVELLLETKNISLNYTCLPEVEDAGNISDNFTVSGMMEQLYANKVDLLFGGLSVNNRRNYFFDFLCVHLAYEDMYVPATHTADLIERWKIVVLMFNGNVWLLLFLILVLCAVMLSDFEKLCIIRNTHTMCEFLNLFGNATQNVALALREKLFKNFLIIHWLWFIFLISCFYQTRLTSFTTYPLSKPQIDQYFSLYEYNFTPCIPRDVIKFLKNSGQVPIINEENIEMSNCATGDLALNEVANTNDKYTVTMYFQYLWWIRNNAKVKKRIHLMEESVYNNIYGLFFKRGFPLLESFNVLTLRLPEHGFVHAAKDFHRLPRKLGSGDNTLLLVQTSLKLKDLTIPFGILVTGMVFALIAFMVEIIHKRNIDDRLDVLNSIECDANLSSIK